MVENPYMEEWNISYILLLVLLIYIATTQSIIIKFFYRKIKRKNHEIEKYQKQVSEYLQRENELISRLKEKEFREKLNSGPYCDITIESEKNTISLWEKLKNPMNNPLNENDWIWLQKSLDDIYSNYTHRMKDIFPKLSKNDFHLLYLLKLNLNVTEISYLLDTSIHNVGNMRYRLKKKLGLHDEDLDEFLQKF